MIKDKEILRKMIREEILKSEMETSLIEGIDIDNDKKIISFNPNHEDNVDTSILLNPTYDVIDGINVISIFKRKDNLDKTDGNPLIYALKNKKGWKFKNQTEDIINLLKQFIRIAEKIKPEYATIITVPSSNPLNTYFLHRLNKIIQAKTKVTDYFYKLNADDVWEDWIAWGEITKDFGEVNDKKVKVILLQYFKAMEQENSNMFSFRFIKDTKLRKYIKKTMWSKDKDEKQIKYAPFINDKDILILDDTISSGASISEACKGILESFVPKTITVITLFSKI